MENSPNINYKKIFFKAALLGILALSSFYYLLLWFITKDFRHPIAQFSLFQPWMTLLIIGFGIQVGLFWLMKKGVSFNIQEKKDAGLAMGTGTTVSGVAMVACCAHHLVEVLPILGFSVAAVFLTKYQMELLIFSVIINIVGILLMLWLMVGKTEPRLIVKYLINKIRK